MKPYQTVIIKDCGEPLVPIPLDQFVVEQPPPYLKLGADYQGKSPYYLRQGVLKSLENAQASLQQEYGWSLKIFFSYRPVSVQRFMVDYTYRQLLTSQNLVETELTHQQRQQILEKVYQIWAVPSENPATPPPHSTGAAIDLTLIDSQGNPLDIGGEIDELSERSQPNYYAQSTLLEHQIYHQQREILYQAMRNAGFHRHPGEWWHFSLGDQMWAYQESQNQPHLSSICARYGRV